MYKEKSLCVPNILDQNNKCKKNEMLHEISSTVYQDRKKKQRITVGTSIAQIRIPLQVPR